LKSTFLARHKLTVATITKVMAIADFGGIPMM
jgi:hypothetical protein